MSADKDHESRMKRLVHKAPTVTPEPSSSTVGSRVLVRKSPDELAANRLEQKAIVEKEIDDIKSAINDLGEKLKEARKKLQIINSHIEKAEAEKAAIEKAKAPKSKEELYHIIGSYIKGLNPKDYHYEQTGLTRFYMIPYPSMPTNIKETVDAVKKTAVEYEDLSLDGAKYSIRPKSIYLQVKVSPYRESFETKYLYRDVFKNVGASLSSHNEHLSKQIKNT